MDKQLSDDLYRRYGSMSNQVDLMQPYWGEAKFIYEQNFQGEEPFQDVKDSLIDLINSDEFVPEDRNVAAIWETGTALVPPSLVMVIFHGLCGQACLDHQDQAGAFYHLSRGHMFLGRLEGRVLFDESMRAKESTAMDRGKAEKISILKSKVLEVLRDTEWTNGPRPRNLSQIWKRISGALHDWMGREDITTPDIKGLPAAVTRWANHDVPFGLRYDSLVSQILEPTDASDQP